jgi:yecA family protein
MAINTFPQEVGLTDAEPDRLAEFLSNSKGGQAMNIEQLDGFFAALIAGPDVVPPSEYLPEVSAARCQILASSRDLTRPTISWGQ